MKNKLELEQLLPDYVFGRLNNEEKIEFEKYVTDYPDLLKEIEDVKSVFNKVEKMDFDKILDLKTRNLSVKINNRLQYQKIKSNNGFLYKYAIPVAFVIAIMIIFVQNFNTKQKNINDEAKFSTKLNSVLNDYDYNNEEAETNTIFRSNEYNKDFSDIDLILEYLNEENSDFKYEINDLLNYDNFFDNNFDNFTENEFQEFLEDINNVKI